MLSDTWPINYDGVRVRACPDLNSMTSEAE